MTAELPAQRISRLQNGVPHVRGCGDIAVAHSREALHVEPGRAKCALAAKTDARNSQFRDNVISEAVLGSTMHREPRESNTADVYHRGTDKPGPTDGAVLRQVVMQCPKAGEVLRHETLLAAE